MESKTFKALEHSGWMERAEAYDDIFALVANQATQPILNTLRPLDGKRLLDVACGTGNLTAQAVQKGATAEGIDFASSMVAKARENYHDIVFREGDAELLPYEDGSFDCVVCAFGLLHIEHPEKAISEAFRVLCEGGQFTFTVWCSPAQGNEFFKLVLGAIQNHGTMDVDLPPAPPIFRFADSDECAKTLQQVGFQTPTTRIVPVYWRGNTPQDALDLIYKGIVRTPLILNEQTPEARDRIHDVILKGVEGYRNGKTLEVAFPAFLVSTTKS